MYPQGVELREFVRIRTQLDEEEEEAARDFATDYITWTRSAFEWNAQRSERLRSLRKVCNRSILPSLEDISCAFGLTLPAKYVFTPYAQLQEFSVSPIQECNCLSSIVRLGDFPTVHNLVRATFDSHSALKYYGTKSREVIVYSRELVTQLALYLNERVNAINAKTHSILVAFGDGRLARCLKDTGLLQTPIIPLGHKSKKKISGSLPIVGSVPSLGMTFGK